MKIVIYGKLSVVFRIIFLLISLVVCVFIFNMSAQNASESSKISGGFIYKLAEFLNSEFKHVDFATQQSIVENFQFIIRKSAHFIIYAFLAFNVCGFCSTFKVNFKQLLLFPFLFSVAYAVSDELHQLFVAGRSCEFRDVLIDSAGAFLGIIAFILLLNVISKLHFRKNRVRGNF